MDVDALTDKINLQAFPGYTDAVILGKLNEAQQDLASRFTWPFLFSTENISLVAATATYALPTDVLQVVELIHDGEGAATPLDRIDVRQVKELYGDDPGSADLPRYYVQEGLSLTFIPTPSATKTVHVKCYMPPADLSAGTDEPAFHPAFHSSLVDYVIAEFWEQEELEERAGYYWNRYFNTLERMAMFYGSQLPAEDFVIGGGIWRARVKPFTNWPEV